MGKKGVGNFWPLRIAGEGEEDIRLVVVPYNGHWNSVSIGVYIFGVK